MRSPGPIALIGGGEHMPATVGIDRRLLDLVGVRAPRVVVVPLAPAPRQLAKTVALARNHWTRLGARFTVTLPTFGVDHALDALGEADIAVIPGGHPNKLIAGLGASPLTDLLIERWLDGMAVSGSSAGAMGVFEWRINLYPPNPLRLLPALGLLDGYVAAPHFDRFRAASWTHRLLGAFDGLGVIGLDEATGLVGHNSDFHVTGSGTVTIVDQAGATVYPSGAWAPIDLLAGSRIRMSPPHLETSVSGPALFQTHGWDPSRNANGHGASRSGA